MLLAQLMRQVREASRAPLLRHGHLATVPQASSGSTTAVDATVVAPLNVTESDLLCVANPCLSGLHDEDMSSDPEDQPLAVNDVPRTRTATSRNHVHRAQCLSLYDSQKYCTNPRRRAEGDTSIVPALVRSTTSRSRVVHGSGTCSIAEVSDQCAAQSQSYYRSIRRVASQQVSDLCSGAVAAASDTTQ